MVEVRIEGYRLDVFEGFDISFNYGVADIRIWNSGSLHTIRVDSQGLTIHTPQRIDIVSEGEMRFKSVRNDMYFDAERIWFYTGDPSTSRMVLRANEGGRGRSI